LRNAYSRGATAGIFVSAVWVIGLTIISKVLGMLKEVVVASKFGTSSSLDAFLVAFGIPILVNSWLRSPIRSGFIPLFTEAVEKKGEKAAWRDAGIYIGDYLTLKIALVIVAEIFAPWIVSTIAPGFGPEEHRLTVNLTRIMLGAIALGTVSGFMTDLLHCEGNFALPGLTQPVDTLMLMGAAFFLTDRFGVMGLAFGVLAGSVVSLLIKWQIVWRHRSELTLGFDLKHPMFLGVLKLATPLLIGMAGAKLDVIVDRVFASQLAAGSISGLSYALQLIEIPREIIVFGLSTVLFPFFSRMVAKGQFGEFSDRLVDSMRISFYLLFPISVALAMLGEPFVRLVFQRGAFGEQSVQFTTSALLLYTPTVWALGITAAMISGFVAMKDTKTPVIAGFIRLGVKVSLAFVFVRIFQHAGLALATSISHVFKLVLFLFLLPAEVRRGRYGVLFRGFVGTAAATAVMAGVLYFLIPLLRQGVLPSFGVRAAFLAGMAGAGTAAFVGASYVFARRELVQTLSAVRQGLGTILRRGEDVPADDDGID
jgi:putative peptidoglycan lipid II flippase